ncbi:MAG TPA: SagB/ThcOx family dehydrogenase [Candidatus Acidoferrales bacterium]|nr:SagB/ThcOx family dehydrogenase [Candidatus Acidoferrales bacterium]
MTRFLSHALADLEGAGINEETERLFAYHHATKHSYHSVRTHAHFLDWRNQPDPFRTYEGAPLVTLPAEPGFPAAGAFATMAALAEGVRTADGSASGYGEEVRLEATWLSRLLWHSIAISAWKKIPQTNYRYSLRVNPSSGNLHPTETYLALLGFAGLDDGLYHYRADRHSLELRSRGGWTEWIARALGLPWAAESPLIIGLTSIFWREAWKYRDRAYRYCCHDLGHAMMSLLLAARALGLPGGVVAHFSDLSLTQALGLTGSDEAPMAFLVFPPQSPSGRLPVRPQRELAGVPNELSAEEVPYYLLLGMHRSTILPDPPGPLPRFSSANAGSARDQASSLNGARDTPLGLTVRRRRSALDFDARTPLMERAGVEQLLDFATRDWPADWRGNFGGEGIAVERGATFVTLYLYFHRVGHSEPGVYRWDHSSRRLEQLHRGNVERVAAYLSLEQALAGNACFAVSMIANLAEVARVFGNRGYRYVHFEAGAIGQKLYIGAEALGWNATGIGAFYDDDVHRYLGFLEEGEAPVDASFRAAEHASLVMLGSPSSRAAAQERDPRRLAPLISESGEEHLSSPGQLGENKEEPTPRRDAPDLPRQVIYHFAVGRAIPDPRLEA